MPPMCHHITTRYTCGHSLLPSPDDPPCTRSCAEHRGVLSYFKAKKTGEICPACRTGNRLLAAGAAQELLEWDAERGKATGAAGGGGGKVQEGGKIPEGGALRKGGERS